MREEVNAKMNNKISKLMVLTLAVSILLPTRSQAQDKPIITGEDFISVFAVEKREGRLQFSPDIPDEHGKPQKGKGKLWTIPTLSVSGERVSKTITDGFLWTPRAVQLGKLDLTTKGKVTDLKDFDWETFKKADEVIAFANGYGVNLFGAIIKQGSISPPCLGLYLTNEGKQIPGRLVSEKNAGGKSTIEETIIEASPNKP
jgi:hypothetical protein